MNERIAKLRKEKGLSQEELAEIVGVSRQAVSKWESGQSIPDIEKIVIMCDYFQVTSDYLIRGTDAIQLETPGWNARLCVILATACNFIGLVVAIAIWNAKRTSTSVAVGLICMVFGCIIFAMGRVKGRMTESTECQYWKGNIWLLSLIPASCIFNYLQGTLGGFWWTYSPFPQMGNSRLLYMAFWWLYIAVCLGVDVYLMKRGK